MRWGSSVRPGEGSNVLTSTYRRRWSNLRDYFNDGSDGMVLALLQALLASKRDMKRSRTQNGTESDDVAGNMRMTDRLAIFLTNNIFRNQEARWCRQQVPSDVYFYGYRIENYWKTSDDASGEDKDDVSKFMCWFLHVLVRRSERYRWWCKRKSEIFWQTEVRKFSLE